MLPQPILSDMPLIVKEKIVALTDPVARTTLRLSNSYKHLVEITPVHYERLTISLCREIFQICLYSDFGRHEVVYIGHEEGYKLRNDESGFQDVIRGKGDYMNAAVARITNLFKNPKFSVEEVKMVLLPNESLQNGEKKVTRFLRELGESLTLLKRQLLVKTLTMNIDTENNDIVPFLQCLLPGTLKSIEWNAKFLPNGNPETHKIMRMAHWKMAESVKTKAIPLPVAFTKWSHFKTCCGRVGHLSQRLVQSIVEDWITSPISKTEYTLDFTTSSRSPILQYLQQFPSHEKKSKMFYTVHPIGAKRKCVILFTQNRIFFRTGEIRNIDIFFNEYSVYQL